MIAAILAAAMCLTPQGHKLTLAGDHFPTTAELDAVDARAEGLRYIAQRPGGWRKLALDAQDPFIWPLDQWVFALTKSGSKVPAIEFFVATATSESASLPGMWIIRLGREPLRLDPQKLMRLRYRGTMAVMLFARFPVDSQIAGIAVDLREPSERR